jgi:hypothetical protein
MSGYYGCMIVIITTNRDMADRLAVLCLFYTGHISFQIMSPITDRLSILTGLLYMCYLSITTCSILIITVKIVSNMNKCCIPQVS